MTEEQFDWNWPQIREALARPEAWYLKMPQVICGMLETDREVNELLTRVVENFLKPFSHIFQTIYMLERVAKLLGDKKTVQELKFSLTLVEEMIAGTLDRANQLDWYKLCQDFERRAEHGQEEEGSQEEREEGP